jgi:hypothetical protein
MTKPEMNDLVILLPGIMGSVLSKDGRVVWAPTGGALWRWLKTLGDSIQDLRIDPTLDSSNEASEGVVAERLVSDVHMIPGLWKIDGYTKLSSAIQSHFGVALGLNFFEFPYDWRRDNRVAARRLAEFSLQRLHHWRERSGKRDAKLVLVAHSMGGLVARHFIECMEGWRETRALVTFGTPYRGAVDALRFLALGMRKVLGPITVADLSNLLRSFPATYQLLPVYPCCRLEGGTVARLSEITQIPNVDPIRVRAAQVFHEEIRSAVEQNMRNEAYVRTRYALHPIVGIFQPTTQGARFHDGRLEMEGELDGQDMGGDGTVPRISATPTDVLREAGALFVSERHGSLQNLDAAITQLKGILDGLALDTSKYFAPIVSLQVRLEDAYADDEPVALAARPSDEPATLSAEITDVETGQLVGRYDLVRDTHDGWHRCEAPPLTQGAYRVRVQGGYDVQPVTDVFCTFDHTAV